MGRPPCCDKSNVRRGLWSAEEDAKLLAFVSNHGVGNWTEVPKKAGLNRCGKSCRLRWTNYLRPDLKHDGFTPHEEELIIYLHKLVGSRWSLIAKHLPGRTDNDVKNCWNTRLRKKLQKMGIDPITHRPISQVLLDYGNISTGLPTSRDPFDFLTTPSLSASKQEQPTINSAMPSNNTANCSLSSDSFALMDPLPQFQVTCQGNIQAQVTYSCSSSSSSSTPLSLRPLSSPQSSSWQPFPAKPPSHSNSFSWNQFLICDQDEGQDFSAMSSSDSSLTDANANNIHKSGNMERCESLAHDAEQATTTTGADHSSSPGTSFIDSILDKDGEMQSQFPQLLDSSFDYF